jgi:multidrug efflux pump subunit AcrA (membrane-fusion protein)
MNKKITAFIVVPLILGGAFYFNSVLSSQKKAPRKLQTPETINYVKIENYLPKTIETNIEAYGRVGSSQQINLVAEVGGKLLQGSVPLKRGQAFRKGQLLCKIYSTEQKLNLQAQKSRFLNTLASILPDIKIDFTSSYDIWQKYFDSIELTENIPTMPKSKSSKEKIFLATKNILSDYYAIKSAEENLKKYTVYAPYDGSIQTLNFEVGSVVNPGTNVASIIRTDKLELEIPCEVRDIKYIEIGKSVSVFGDSPNNIEWKGKVSRIARFVDANTQSISVFIDITNQENYTVLDGSFLKASIPGKKIENAVSVPRSIIKNKNEVFVVADSVLQTRKIVVHKLNKSTAVISGLKNGDNYVVDMPSNASENMKVQIVNN